MIVDIRILNWHSSNIESFALNYNHMIIFVFISVATTNKGAMTDILAVDCH